MPFVSLRALVSGWSPARRGRLPLALVCAALSGMLTLGGFAQIAQPPSRTPKPIILPEANRVPDANDQMLMREQSTQNRHFDAANAERLKQLMEATEMLQTMAIALEAEVDKSGDMSTNTLHKADTIEKLARIVKERMTLTVTPR